MNTLSGYGSTYASERKQRTNKKSRAILQIELRQISHEQFRAEEPTHGVICLKVRRDDHRREVIGDFHVRPESNIEL